MRIGHAFGKTVFLHLAMLLLMGTSGCKNGEKTASAKDEVPSDFEVIFGRQGTFAGRGMGYSINGNGEVVRWEGKYPGENKEAIGTADAKEVNRLWQRAREIGILRMKDQAMAAANSFISVTAGGESRRVTWAERKANALTPAQEFYDECLRVAKTALREYSDGESAADSP